MELSIFKEGLLEELNLLFVFVEQAAMVKLFNFIANLFFINFIQVSFLDLELV